MLKEILLTDNEKDTILGLCQNALDAIKSEMKGFSLHNKMTCTHVGMVICRVKGVRPHDNHKYLRHKYAKYVPTGIHEFPTKVIKGI